MDNRQEPSSFRDPAGRIFYKDNLCYRQINEIYHRQYDKLMHSGLYRELTEKHSLIPHEEITPWEGKSGCIIRPETIPYISYPYEWSFEQLKDAAVLTLDIMLASLKYDMVIKDASAYNVQFLKGHPIFIDTLSFEFYEENSPWGAYGQFCRHFAAPPLPHGICRLPAEYPLQGFY